MAGTIEFLPDKGYILARISGPVSLQIARRLIADVAEASRKNGCTRIMMDVRQATAKASTLDLHGFASHLEDYGLDRLMKVAVVTSKTLGSPHFVETVARNRGFDLTVFYHYAEGEAWLVRNAVPAPDGGSL
jgi:hypothetical protein